MTDSRMPALFLSHGAPPLLDDALWTRQLRDVAGRIPRPTAILVASAHWESAPLTLSASGPGTELVYDFAGFDPKYHAVRYDTPDASALAQRVADLMPDGERVHQHRDRGLDHGAWVPLSVMYPEADVPVVQMSLPSHDPQRLLGIGRRLAELRDEGVLVVGSGFTTHGLPFLTDPRPDATAPGWSVDFDDWAREAMARGDVDELSAYRDRAPGMPFAHPTPEHFSPLFLTLGAATRADDPGEQVIDGFWIGLAKRSLLVA